jgi:hypothetical protein
MLAVAVAVSDASTVRLTLETDEEVMPIATTAP